MIGPGTGLGMGYLLKDKDSDFYTIGSSEGGHQDYTSKNEDNFALREYFKKSLGNTDLSIERVLSGQGLILIYKYLKSSGSTAKRDKELETKIDNFNGSPTSPEANEINIELVNKGLYGDCELSKKVLEYFISVFGDVAGDVVPVDEVLRDPRHAIARVEVPPAVVEHDARVADGAVVRIWKS